MINELRGRLILLYNSNMLFYPLYYDIICLTSLKITQAFHLSLDFAENQRILKFKIVLG